MKTKAKGVGSRNEGKASPHPDAGRLAYAVIFTTRILAHGKNVRKKMEWISSMLHADDVQPWEYECRRCHQCWNDAVLTNPREVSCSNCYSDNVLLSAVLLRFEDWGEQNGGQQECEERYHAALLYTSAAIGPTEPTRSTRKSNARSRPAAIHRKM